MFLYQKVYCRCTFEIATKDDSEEYPKHILLKGNNMKMFTSFAPGVVLFGYQTPTFSVKSNVGVYEANDRG